MKFRTPGWNVQPEVYRGLYQRRPNHFKSALGGATYVYASWDSLPPDVWSTQITDNSDEQLIPDVW